MPLLHSRSLAPIPLPFRDKQPDRPHQMLGGDIDIPFPENLRDPMNANSALVGFEALFLAFSPRASRLAFRTRHRRHPRHRKRLLAAEVG